MNFIKRGLEYNKLAKAFNGYYQMIQPLVEKSNYEDIRDDLFIIAFLARKEIIDRMEVINYKLTTRIVVPMMPGNNKTLEYAYLQTVGKLMTLGENQGYSDEVQDILDKGNLYFELENTIPSHLKTLLKL